MSVCLKIFFLINSNDITTFYSIILHLAYNCALQNRNLELNYLLNKNDRITKHTLKREVKTLFL